MSRTIAFVLYPGITPLDLIGPLQVLSPLGHFDLGYEVVVVGETTDPLPTDTPVRLSASHTFAEVPSPYAIVVPGGDKPTLRALADETLISYLREAGRTAEVIASVCTGALLLAAAGLLDGRRATTHWAARDLLANLGATPVAERWVEDGPTFTSAGVSAGIDLGLHLAAKLTDEATARLIQLIIEYDPEPPLGPIDWSGTESMSDWMTNSAQEALADHPDLLARLTT